MPDLCEIFSGRQWFHLMFCGPSRSAFASPVRCPFLRSGKYLADTATEVLVELKPLPQRLFANSARTTGPANYLRLRLSPNSAIALAARVKIAGKEFVGDQRELYQFEELVRFPEGNQVLYAPEPIR
jgi:hypothetical protein